VPLTIAEFRRLRETQVFRGRCPFRACVRLHLDDEIVCMDERVSGLAAIVLTGGQSRRMGQPKAWLPIGGETFLQRIIRIVGMVADERIVVAADRQDLPDLPADVAVVRDSIAAAGPLVGLETGWRALRTEPVLVFVCGCDTPLLKPAFIRTVARACVGNEAAVPVTDGQRHPLAACYSSVVLSLLPALIANGERRMQAFLDRLSMYELHADEFSTVDPGLESLININSPEDWAVWQKQIASAAGDE
jgi:molybdenum cofactor guanylyltransferase